MRYRASVALLALLLGGCAATTTTVCPSLVSYTETEQNRLAGELDAAPADAVWPDMIIDYVSLRDQIRAACPG